MTSQEISRRRADSRLADIGTMIEQYTQQVDRLAEEGDYAALGAGLGRLRGLRQDLSALERYAEDHLADLLPRKRVEEDGMIMERRRSTTRRAWDHEALFSALWNLSFADKNGELDEEGQAERFRVLVEECLRPEWRVTPLRAIGLQTDEFCEETPGRTTVQVYTQKDEDNDVQEG